MASSSTLKRLILALVVATAAAACSSSTEPSDLSDNREKWRETGIASYDIRFRLICFCVLETTEPVILQVRNRAIVAVTRVSDGRPVDPSEWRGRYYTVDEMFALISEARARGADEVRVAYDSGLGYPTEVYIDQSFGIADEERHFELSGLVRR